MRKDHRQREDCVKSLPWAGKHWTNLAEVHLIEDDLVGMADTPKSGDEGENCRHDKTDSILEIRVLGLLLRSCLCLDLDVELGIRGGRDHRLLGAGVALAHAALRGGSRGRHGGETEKKTKEIEGVKVKIEAGAS